MTDARDLGELRQELKELERRRDEALAEQRDLKARPPPKPVNAARPWRHAAITMVVTLIAGILLFAAVPKSRFDEQAEGFARERLADARRELEQKQAHTAYLKRRTPTTTALSEPEPAGLAQGDFPCLAAELPPEVERNELVMARWANVAIAACKNKEVRLAAIAVSKIARQDTARAKTLAVEANRRCLLKYDIGSGQMMAAQLSRE